MTARAAALAAYVLHRWDWSETSLIVELFTRERGRLVVAAKGAKRPTSQLRAVLLPFQPLAASLGKAPAEAEIHTLRGAEWAGGAPLLPAGALLAGYYLNELVLKLLAREDAHPALWDAYAAALAALARAGGDDGPALRAFELQLLREAGLLPALHETTLTAAPLADDAAYTLHAEAGLVDARDGAGLAGRHWRTLAAALDAGDTAALQRACAAAGAALRGPLRELLHYHLGTSTLRTREVGRGLQRLADPRRAP